MSCGKTNFGCVGKIANVGLAALQTSVVQTGEEELKREDIQSKRRRGRLRSRMVGG
jgi:hypothetical protein